MIIPVRLRTLAPRLTPLAASLLFAGLAMPAQADILTLASALEKARSHDPQWAAIRHANAAAQEFATLGQSGLLPKLNAQASSEHSEFDGTPQGNFPASDSSTGYGWGVNIKQPLYNMAAWYDWKKGQAATAQANADYAAREQDFLVRVVTTYFDVLRAQVALDTRKAEEAAVARQLEQTQQRFKVGLVPKTDVLEAQAGYDLTVVARIGAETQVQVAIRNLASLTHTPVDAVKDLADNAPVNAPEPADQAAWVQRALDNNPALKAAKQGETVALEQYQSAKAGHFPTIDAMASRGFSSVGSFGVEDVTSTSWGVQLTVPIYNGGAVSASRRQTMNQYYQAREEAQYARQSTDLGTANLYLLVTNHVQRVNAYAQSIRSAESALTATQAGYEAGTRTVVDVLGAQKTLYGARSDYANARYDYVVDTLRLKQSAGMLGNEDVLTLNSWLQK